jgi:hypothetical protein
MWAPEIGRFVLIYGPMPPGTGPVVQCPHLIRRFSNADTRRNRHPASLPTGAGEAEETKKKDEEERLSKARAPYFVFLLRLSTLSFAFPAPVLLCRDGGRFIRLPIRLTASVNRLTLSIPVVDSGDPSSRYALRRGTR